MFSSMLCYQFVLLCYNVRQMNHLISFDTPYLQIVRISATHQIRIKKIERNINKKNEKKWKHEVFMRVRVRKTLNSMYFQWIEIHSIQK